MIVRWSIAAWRLLVALFFESVERGGGTHERYWRVGMACELRHPVSALQALGEISHQRAIASCQHVDVDSLDDLRDAAVEWAAGGRGQPLVDAVVNALVAGADTPALVLLAGATRALADEEAAEFAPRMFDELGLVVHERRSEAAYLAAARLEARRFLEKGGSGRDLAGRMYLLYVNAGYPSELNDWAGFDDYYDMLRDGVIGGNVLDLDADVRAAARKFVDSDEPVERGLTGPAEVKSPTARESWWRHRRLRDHR
jgi:hypothetical protein